MNVNIKCRGMAESTPSWHCVPVRRQQQQHVHRLERGVGWFCDVTRMSALQRCRDAHLVAGGERALAIVRGDRDSSRRSHRGGHHSRSANDDSPPSAV